MKKISLLLCLFISSAQLFAQSISGNVYNDANNNGIKDGFEVGYPYVTINAYAPGAALPTASAVSSASPINVGDYTITGLVAGVSYRIEFVTPNGYHDGAKSSGAANSNVQFATTGATGVNYGFRYANECTINSNPRLIAGQCYTYNGAAGNGSPTNALMSWTYGDRTTTQCNTCQVALGYGTYATADLSHASGVGAPTSVSFDSKSKLVYFASWAAISGVFPQPTNGYYSLHIANYGGAGNTYQNYKLLVDLASIGLNTTPLNQISTFPNNSAGSAGLGQVALSNDAKTLYIVNMSRGNIAKLDVSGVNYASLPVTAPTAANLSEVNIPVGIPNAVGGVFRPFALKLKGNYLYIGGINDASVSLNNANLEMVVLAMDLTTQTFTKIFSHNLNTFTASITQQGYGYGGIWGKTQNFWRFSADIYEFQPFLNAIEFDDYGALLIGVTNRQVYTSATNWQAGYMVRASKTANGYVLENNGLSGGLTSAARRPGSNTPGNHNVPDGPGGKWFYENEYTVPHGNSFAGGIYCLPGSGEVVAGFMDPTAWNEEGARYFNSSNGLTVAGKATQAGKAVTLTGTEAVCDANPIEIGNRVWVDLNGDGIQDGNEPAVSGVTVVLYNPTSNTVIATAITDANGNYLFSTAPGTNTSSNKYALNINFNANYELRVTALGNNPLLSGFQLNYITAMIGETPNTQNSGTTIRNSDAFMSGGLPTIFINTGAPGENNYTYDFGFKNCIADAGSDIFLNCTTTSGTIGTPANGSDTYSWAPPTGLNNVSIAQPIASPNVTTTYTLTVNGTCTDIVTVNVDNTAPNAQTQVAGDVCNGSTTNVTASGGGTYAWSNGSNNASITVGAGTYTVTVTSANGCTATSTATVINKQGSAGNYVWTDVNGNGINDEAPNFGINGVAVELWDATNNVLVQSTVTANDGLGNPGYYNFIICNSGNYKIKFPTNISGQIPTEQNPTPGVDNNSDVASDGFSPVFNIDINGNGVNKDNATIDAGYYKPACLGNYVWNDTDKDGIQNNGEVGIAGIVVTLYDNNNVVMGTTLTDAYGYYRFCTLSPGSYYLHFSLPPNYVFTNSNAGIDDELDSDVNGITGTTGLYVISSGDSNMSIDAGIYFVQPSTASVGDYVWMDTNQDGIQNNGEVGISGVTVSLYNALNELVAVTITDANGFYLFTNVIPGTYSVGFSTPPGLMFTQNNGGINNPSNSDANPLTGKTTPFVLNAGDNIRYIDAGLYAISVLNPLLGGIGDHVWYDMNMNGIQDAGEPGVSGITVTLYASDGNTVLSSTSTDGYGYYVFNNLPMGSYVVGFSNLPVDYVFTQKGQGDSVRNSDADILSGKTDIIHLGAGQYNMTYDAGIYSTNVNNTNSIGDRVWHDIDKDGIQDAGEPGVGGITVTLYDALNNVVAVTFTNVDGYYLFPNLPNGSYYVVFSNLPIGYVYSPTGQGTSDTDSDADPVSGTTGTILLVGNTHITDVDAGIYMGNTKIGKGSLGDRVWYDMNGNGIQDATESGVGGVLVTLYESDGVTVISTTSTNALGNYIFTNLDAGNYIVGFSNIPMGFVISPKDADNAGINGEQNSDVNSGSGKTDVVALGQGEDKLSVDMGIVPPVGTAGLGNYVWIDLDQDGLQDAGEPGVPGVMVTLYDGMGNVAGTTTTDLQGEYYFVGLAPGSYSVGFSNLPQGYTFTSYNTDNMGINGASNSDADELSGITQSVTLASGDFNTNIDAGIKSNIVASVGDYVWYDINRDGIQDMNEPGIVGILVTLYDNNDVAVATTLTNAQGYYIFSNVIPGTYSIGFSQIPSGMLFTQQELDPLSSNGSNANTVTGITPSFTVLAGTHNPTIDAGLTTPLLSGLGNYVWHDVNEDGLQDAGEPGVAGVLVTLYDGDGVTTIATTVTDGNGMYSFTELQAGDYKVGFSQLPPGSTRTKVVGILNDVLNSDMQSGGMTETILLASGEYNPNIDAGIYYGVPLSARNLLATAAIIEGETNCNVYWYTEVETNTKDLYIERSIDGTNYTHVGTVQAKGTTTGRTQYQYMDNIGGIEKGQLIYYRIRLNDIDGYKRYSNVVTARQNTGDNIIVYPTLFKDELTIEYKSIGQSDVTIKLQDASGRTIREASYEITEGHNRIKISELNNLSSGNYYLRIENANAEERYTLKLQKQ